MQTKEISVVSKKNERSYIRGMGNYYQQIQAGGGGHDSVPFYPLYYNQYLNRKLPVFIDMNNLSLVIKSVPAVHYILGKRGELLRNGRMRLFKYQKGRQQPCADDEEIFSDPFLDLMRTPNCEQGYKDFIQQWCWMRDLYGYSLIYEEAASRYSFPTFLWTLPSGEIIHKPTGYLFSAQTDDEVMDRYEWQSNQNPDGGIKYFEPPYIIRYVDDPMDMYTWGISKLVINKLHLSNLQLSAQTSNVIMADRGALGILSNQATDMAGAIPMDIAEQKRIGRQYNRDWGIGEEQEKVIVTNSNLKWQAIGYPRAELMLDEIYELSFCAICDAYGVPRKLFSDTVASTGKETIGGDGKGKIEEAQKICIQTTIVEVADSFCEPFNKREKYNLVQRGYYCKITFDHLPVMQDEKLDKAQEESYMASGAAQRTNAIITLNQSVIQGQMDRDAAVAILVNVHKMEPEVAEQIILEPKKIQEPQEESEEVKKYRQSIKSLLC